MNYINILLPFGLMVFGGLVVYAIGFGVGRRAAYREVELNLGDPGQRRWIA